MADIHELPVILSDQIAAGEVAERPASVVKELVENSIDANSNQIDITVKDAGLSEITIIDNGDGIKSTDVELAFKRHATSKINSSDDLFQISSLGFRGEALPSISSVSHLIMKTAQEGKVGKRIEINGGKLIENSSSESRTGTYISVSNLFFNTPARLKYMKSQSTELAKITDIVNRLSLSHPDIAFSLQHNQRELLRTSGRNDLQQVLSGIYGKNIIKQMIKIEGSDNDFEVSGYVSLPDLTRASRKYLSLIINGRYIKDFMLDKSIINGYGSKLMIGRYPIAVLNIKMDPKLVDVNVHPTKQEVRISKKDELQNLISKLIDNGLATKNLIPDACNKNIIDKKETKQTEISFENSTPKVNFEQKNDDKLVQLNENKPNEIIINDIEDLQKQDVKNFDIKYKNEKSNSPFGDQNIIKDSIFPILKYIGQFHGTYILAEAEDGLYILDQHAAQERINYEFYLNEIGSTSKDRQTLLVPLVLNYSITDSLKINDNLSSIEQFGIGIENFGKSSFIIRNYPAWFKEGQEESTVKEILDWVLNDKKIDLSKFREKAVIMMSCKRAIKANHHLDELESKELLKNIRECDNPYNCPHGRPVLIHFSENDMETMFKRIQDPHKNNEED
ncbi:DNA mismatch repair endonuclease MutL [Lactobacillus sp. S2-2]|uniref:DNA mismatch repair endonuclease MutL n=1 Tax=Lactobacillus sp. S2-2 TaxID=2692917 RepID=UPI001EFF8345|nr:DNA mismatch repair endonuclease MutL [Lactobacillus sp. S2-2]MCF6515804.1 DNA mismatch repair endonuclease MutL [Lactobacillus sp. S2-2]